MTAIVKDLKKLAKKVIRKDAFAQAVQDVREEARYNLTEELREKYADFYGRLFSGRKKRQRKS